MAAAIQEADSFGEKLSFPDPFFPSLDHLPPQSLAKTLGETEFAWESCAKLPLVVPGLFLAGPRTGPSRVPMYYKRTRPIP